MTSEIIKAASQHHPPPLGSRPASCVVAGGGPCWSPCPAGVVMLAAPWCPSISLLPLCRPRGGRVPTSFDDDVLDRRGECARVKIMSAHPGSRSARRSVRDDHVVDRKSSSAFIAACRGVRVADHPGAEHRPGAWQLSMHQFAILRCAPLAGGPARSIVPWVTTAIERCAPSCVGFRLSGARSAPRAEGLVAITSLTLTAGPPDRARSRCARLAGGARGPRCASSRSALASRPGCRAGGSRHSNLVCARCRRLVIVAENGPSSPTSRCLDPLGGDACESASRARTCADSRVHCSRRSQCPDACSWGTTGGRASLGRRPSRARPRASWRPPIVRFATTRISFIARPPRHSLAPGDAPSQRRQSRRRRRREDAGPQRVRLTRRDRATTSAPGRS